MLGRLPMRMHDLWYSVTESVKREVQIETWALNSKVVCCQQIEFKLKFEHWLQKLYVHYVVGGSSSNRNLSFELKSSTRGRRIELERKLELKIQESYVVDESFRRLKSRIWNVPTILDLPSQTPISDPPFQTLNARTPSQAYKFKPPI